METAKKERTAAKSKFTRAANGLRADMTDGPVRTVEQKLMDLRERWREVEEKHEAYNRTLDEPKDHEIWIDEVIGIFQSLEKEADSYIFEVEEKQKNDTDMRGHLEKEMARKLEVLQVATVKEQEQKVEEEKRILRCQELYEKRELEKQKLDKVLNHLQGLMSLEDKETEDLELAIKDDIEEVEKRAKICEDVHDAYVQNKTKEEKRDESGWILKILENCRDVTGKGKIFISRHGESKVTGGKKGIQVEKLKFDRFDESLRRYPKFKEEFMKYIKPRYSKAEQAFALQSYLIPEVAQDIECLGDNMEEVWKRLDAKYGNENRLIDLIMTDIKQLKKCQDENPVATLKMINIIESIL